MHVYGFSVPLFFVVCLLFYFVLKDKRDKTKKKVVTNFIITLI